MLTLPATLEVEVSLMSDGTYRFPGQGVDTSTQVAFKIFRGGRNLASRVREKIKEEVELGMKLLHPNLVILFGMLNHDQYGPVLVLQLCPGGSLSQVLDRALPTLVA